MEYFIQQLVNGITVGSIYGLIAIGYTMVYGIIGMINFAHGDIFMIGAFVALISFIIFGLTGIALPVILLLVLLIAMLFTACYGWTVEKLANTYVAELFLALSQDALNKSSQGFKKLVADSQTPKGLNMQVLNELKKGKFFTKFTRALENVNKRVSK